MAPLKGRTRFRGDLKVAAEKTHVNVSDIKKGEAEDEFTFLYSHPSLPKPSVVEIRVQPEDIGGYPSDNLFLVYTIDDVPPNVAQVLEDSMSNTAGMNIHNMIADVSQRLGVALGGSEAAKEDDDSMVDEDQFDLDANSEGSDEDVPFEYDDEDDYGLVTGTIIDPAQSQKMETLSLSTQQRMRRDLQFVHRTGFHVGKICGFTDEAPNNIIYISIRANKLGLSRETHDAWGISPSEYVVLLIAYDRFYSTFEDVISMPIHPKYMRFRLRKSLEKKPTEQQAVGCFSSNAADKSSYQTREGSELPRILVSKSFDEFMNHGFMSMLKLRDFHGGTWDDARQIWWSRMMNMTEELPEQRPTKLAQPTENQTEHNGEAQLPPFLAPDHMLSDEEEKSLPLIAAQFTLRYLVKCMDYCTVCLERVTENFEALRPYVCSKPLCLDQYVNLGLGPSIDHEIINHPNVVDLLISFCYASLMSHSGGNISIREFPRGLNTRVPKIRRSRPLSEKGHHVLPVPGGVLLDPINVQFDWKTSTASTTTVKWGDDGPLKKDQWVVISTIVEPHDSPGVTRGGLCLLHHARIKSIGYQIGGELSMDLHVVSRHTLPQEPGSGIRDGESFQDKFQSPTAAQLVLCDDRLDDIEDGPEKAFSMLIILAALPSVKDMKEHLMSNQQLADWNRMTPAGMDLVRWILASNRSYIVQVDEDSTDTESSRHREKIYGVDGWMQFRFIQGSPEKEILFKESLEHVDKPQKTLVAWHGSRLGNWHSIVRGGLDYSVCLNGRAFGNGIYFARDFNTSYSYSGAIQEGNDAIWPRSSLQIQSVVGLSELVNRPNEFTSICPHYVVQHCHWTQHRYLFVHRMSESYLGPFSDTIMQKAPSEIPEFIQDPKWAATGPGGRKLFIPKYAIPSVRGELPEYTKSPVDDTKELGMISDDDEEDLMFVYGGEAQVHKTDFRPGTLDFSRLPLLQPPSYGNNIAQKTLVQEIKKLQKVQDSTPLHELGWYMDFARVNNMFQWIVELHSFDSNLPLAQDMKKAGLTSIVLEVRFMRGYPVSPPFVRVIRPRFLPFAQGGGGHVTAGGALCMQLLTNTGWSPANSIESVLLQVRLAICSTDPQPARLEKYNQAQYGIGEAIDAYTRAAQAHGWEVPKDLQDIVTHQSAPFFNSDETEAL